MSRAVDQAALIQKVNELTARAEKLLAAQGHDAKPELADDLLALGDEIEELSHELVTAIDANRVLSEVQGALARRAHAYQEVFGAPSLDECSFGCYTSGDMRAFDWRRRHGADTWRGLDGLTDDDVPF